MRRLTETDEIELGMRALSELILEEVLPIGTIRHRIRQAINTAARLKGILT